jgi:2-polyprenyl-6-methoxyphenol hydroxylase-like FAD-dependent oxidoreductase
MTRSESTTCIAIAGGGLAGLCLAAALTQRNIPYVLFERAQALEPKGAGIALMPPAMRVLERLGLLSAATRASLPVPETRRHRADGKLLLGASYPDLWGGREARAIHRADLQALLLSAATGGEARLGCAVSSARDDGAQVALQAGGEETVCGLLVGADGVRSTLRQLIGGAPARLLKNKIFRTHVSTHAVPPGHTVFFGRRCALGAVQLPTGTYLFANALNNDEEHAGPIAGRRARVVELLSELTAPEAARLIALWPDDAAIHEDAVWEVPVADAAWRKGRIVLIGDAAHAMSPVLGLGGAMAMEDAWVLAEELHATADVDAALDAFVARRTPRIKWVQTASAGIVRRAQAGERTADMREELKAAFEPLFAEP